MKDARMGLQLIGHVHGYFKRGTDETKRRVDKVAASFWNSKISKDLLDPLISPRMSQQLSKAPQISKNLCKSLQMQKKALQISKTQCPFLALLSKTSSDNLWSEKASASNGPGHPPKRF